MGKNIRLRIGDSVGRFYWALLAGAGLGLLGLQAGCNRPPGPAPEKEQAPKAAANQAVPVIRPERKTVRHAIEQPGFNIEAFEETPLYPKIQGYVLKWNVDIGATVHKDDVLAELYVPEMVVDLQRKEAAVRSAKAKVQQAQAAILTAQAQLEQRKSQYERFERLGRTQGLVAQENIDETRFGYHAAQAAVEKAKADKAAAEAQQGEAEEDRNYTQTMLDYATIRAPYDGVVTKRNVNTRDFVQPTGIRGQPLFVVDQLDPVRVFVNVPGADAAWIKDGDPVTLNLQGAGGEAIQGRVTRNARALDPQSRTLRTEIDLPNPGPKDKLLPGMFVSGGWVFPCARGLAGLEHKLLPGMYVQATFTVEHRNVWTLPAGAIRTEGSQTACFRVVNGRAVRTPLQVGLSGGGLVQVLKIQLPSPGGEGRWVEITGQEEVVGENVGALKDGQKVVPAR